MSIYYAKSTGWFYFDQYNTDIPDDAKEITPELHADLMQAQASGKVISSDTNGMPIASEPAPPANADIVASALQTCDTKIAAFYTDMQAADLSDDAATLANTKAAAKPWIAYRKTLLALRTNPQWPDVAIPEAPQ